MTDLVGTAAEKRTLRIRELNDAFRRTFAGGKIVLTASVATLPDMVRANALKAVAEYNAFDGANDPYQEHDFGAFELCGRTFFWKIDYYDKQCEFGSEDPSNGDMTTRVLTLMLAEDY